MLLFSEQSEQLEQCFTTMLGRYCFSTGGAREMRMGKFCGHVFSGLLCQEYVVPRPWRSFEMMQRAGDMVLHVHDVGDINHNIGRCRGEAKQVLSAQNLSCARVIA